MYDNYDIMGALEIVRDDRYFATNKPGICCLVQQFKCKIEPQRHGETRFEWYVAADPITISFDMHDVASMVTTCMLANLPTNVLLLHDKNGCWAVLPKYIHLVEDEIISPFKTPFEALYSYWLGITRPTKRS